MRRGMRCLLAALLCVCGLSLTAKSVSAVKMATWTFDQARPAGVSWHPRESVSYSVTEERTPSDESCGKFQVAQIVDAKVPWSIQLRCFGEQELVAGTTYRCSFYVKADREVKLPFNMIQHEKPWKMWGHCSKKLTVSPEWQLFSTEIACTMSFNGKVCAPMLMLGALPLGTTIWLGPVTLERLETFYPLKLNATWQLFMRPQVADGELAGLTSLPETLGGVSAQTVSLTEKSLDIARISPSFAAKDVAVLVNEFEAPGDGFMQLGCAADYWFEFMVNGKVAYDTLVTGNREQGYLPTDHVFNIPVRKGKNLVVVRVLAGSAGWRFVCGEVPFRQKLSRITQFVRNSEWRPVKMDKVQWTHISPKRIDEWRRIPGSALDLSQYVKKYDIDRNGRLCADSQGRLYFENAPQERVRLRGFNFVPGSWQSLFYKFTKSEIEEYADQIALAGMNVLRFHFLDAALAGNGGLPKQGKDKKRLSDVKMAQSVEELDIDEKFADRYHYLLKCLRDRGIYVMLDIFTSRGLFTEAVFSESCQGRFELFDNERYQRHWQAAYDYLLKHPNPYTGKALLNDPQLIGITCYNEQEHLFTLAANSKGNVMLFDAEWRRHRRPDAPQEAPKFDGELLRADTPDGVAARRFIRGKIAQMNEFYLSYVRQSGFKGFVTNWDMFMRGLEGDARKDFNAVALHTYFAHPNKEKLYPPNYKQRLTYGRWLRGQMVTVSQESSLKLNSYIGRAAAARVLGKPFFMTEYSHCGYNQYVHESVTAWPAYASLQDWQMLAPHANQVQLYYQPFQPSAFDSSENLSGVINSTLCAFGWQRGDIKPAPHAVSFHVPESILDSPSFIGAIGSGYNGLHTLTRIGSDYKNAVNPLATLNMVPESYVGATSMGMWVVLNEEKEQNLKLLEANVAKLRQAGILGPENKTNVRKGIYESETGEICVNLEENTLNVDTPKFQSTVVKELREPVQLSNLSVSKATIPCSITAVSLENERPLAEARRLLLVVATMFTAENAVFSTENFHAELDVGDMQQLMRAGRFEVSLKTGVTGVPKVYALNLNGSRQVELPATLNHGVLHVKLDTTRLEYGTPYFEVVVE